MSDKNKQTKIGKYEILEKIGEGGYGIVYRGRDPMLDRTVAIKVLRADVSTSLDFVERFRREARLAASLRHPNIATVLEVGEEAGRYFLVMDFLPGGPLSSLLEDGKPLPLSRALELLKPIAEALDYAHSKGLIHRDVKPSNIIINEEGKPVLTDFGLVKSLSEESGTTTGMALGTAEYMAPEQILGREPDARTDLYALGVIAFQMLTGRVPFMGTTPFAIQKGHAEHTPPDPRQINPAVGEQLAGVLLKSLEKQSNMRYQSGAEFVSSLGQIASLEEKEYWNGLYQEANNLMEQREFPEALEKWEALQKARPNFQDVPACLSRSRQMMELQDRYSRLAETFKKAEQDAQEILAVDSAFPDGEAVFKRLGLRESPPKGLSTTTNRLLSAGDQKLETSTPIPPSASKTRQIIEKVSEYFVYGIGALSFFSMIRLFIPFSLPFPLDFYRYNEIFLIPKFLVFLFVIIYNWKKVPARSRVLGRSLYISGMVLILYYLFRMFGVHTEFIEELIRFDPFILAGIADLMILIGTYLWDWSSNEIGKRDAHHEYIVYGLAITTALALMRLWNSSDYGDFQLFIIPEFTLLLTMISVIIVDWKNVSSKMQAWGKWLSICGVVFNFVMVHLLEISYWHELAYYVGIVLILPGTYLWNRKV